MPPPPKPVLSAPPPKPQPKTIEAASYSTDEVEQISLFDLDPDWKEKWASMPEFNQDDLTPWQSVHLHFANQKDRDGFAKLVGQTMTDSTRSMWYPRAEIGRIADKRWVSKEPVYPRHPIYIISKGRWESRLTAKSLEAIGIPFWIVVEPQEYDNYAAVINPEQILTLPFSNLGQGSIPARNWVWDHSIEAGAEWHWILDDNIDGFYRLNNNLKVKVETGATFRAIEDFVDRYENVGQAGMNYFMFAARKTLIQPFTLNTRIYSCILNRNSLHQHRWRGRYNEDTDLSIRILKDGLCTVLFNAFLAMKSTTMSMKGGNTEELYKIKQGEKDGRRLMAESLYEQHPDIVQITEKWGRWQHHVDYSGFKKNKLIPKAGLTLSAKPNNYGMILQIQEPK